MNKYIQDNSDNSDNSDDSDDSDEKLNLYINFNIKKYIKIDDVVNLIELIDNKMYFKKKIYGTNIIIKISRFKNLQYDYICKTNIMCDIKIISQYIKFKFEQIEKFIKFTNNKFGYNWYIDYKLIYK